MKNSEQTLISLCPAVAEICQPIFDYLSISFFRYVRSYQNSEKYILCSDKKWLTEYFKEKIYDVEYANYHKIPRIGSGISVHSACTSKDPVCVFWNKQGAATNYNIILALYEKYDAYLEFYNFGLKQDTHATNNIFLNNHNLFHHFIAYFRDQAQDILQTANTVRFACKETNYKEDAKNNWMLGLPENLEKIIIQQMPVEKIYLNGNLDNIYLTVEEAIYSKFLLNGLNNDKISAKMSITQQECLNLQRSIQEKLQLASPNDIRASLINNRVQKKISSLS